jgi:hypothetical protein
MLPSDQKLGLLNENGPSEPKLWSDQTPADFLPNLHYIERVKKGAELCKSFVFIFFRF